MPTQPHLPQLIVDMVHFFPELFIAFYVFLRAG